MIYVKFENLWNKVNPFQSIEFFNLSSFYSENVEFGINIFILNFAIYIRLDLQDLEEN